VGLCYCIQRSEQSSFNPPNHSRIYEWSHIDGIQSKNTKSQTDNLMMDAQNLRERIAQVEAKRVLLLKYQTDPSLSTLSLDIDQALVEMDDLMVEFRQTFPNGIVEPPTVA
jgi:hypothetical protein